MADENGRDGQQPGANDRWGPGEPLPWTKWYWRDWLSAPAIRRMSPDQRGRFMDVFATTHGTDTPGVMTEDDVRAWAGYTPREWAEVRGVFAGAFNTTRRKGKWILEDVLETWKASIQRAKRFTNRAKKAAKSRTGKRRSANEMTSTSRQQAHLDEDTDVRLQSSELKTPAVPDVQPVPVGTVGLTPDGTSGTAAVSDLLERVLSHVGSAAGTSGTGSTAGGHRG